MKKLTDKQRKALEIVRDFGGHIWPRSFAERMWPDSPCWTKNYRCGHGSTSGGPTMAQSGGAFLAKLRRKGLLKAIYVRGSYISYYDISDKGKKALEAGQYEGVD